MLTLSPGCNVVQQLYGGPVIHIGNLTDEMATGHKGFAYNAGECRPATYVEQSLWAYSPRMIGALPNGSLGIVTTPLVAVVQDHLGYLGALGLTESIRVYGVAGDREAPFIDCALADIRSLQKQCHGVHYRALFPFVASRRATQLARELNVTAIPDGADPTELANNKGKSFTALRDRGVSVPYGHWVTDPLNLLDAREDIRHQCGTNAAIFGKLARAVSGLGIWHIASADDWKQFVMESRVQAQLHDPQLGIRLDVEIEAECFPNVMIWVGQMAEEDRLITSSRQILSKRSPTDSVATVHIGNIGPLSEELLDSLTTPVSIIADWLREIGAIGLAGIDFAVERGTQIPYFLEINHRINGNNAAAFIAMQAHSSPVWLANNMVSIPKGTTLSDYVASLHSRQLHFDSGRGTGIFVVNHATASMGMTQIGACASDYEQAIFFLHNARPTK